MKTLEKISEDKDWVRYRTSCACGHDDDSLCIDIEKRTIDVEVEKAIEGDYTDMILYFNVYCPIGYWYDDSFIKKIWRRLKECTKILFTGYTMHQNTFIFRSKEHINDFIEAIQVGVKKIEEK